MTYEEWVQFVNKKDSGISTVMSQSWLLKGCPKCQNKTWQLTNDGWAYCCSCNKGYSTISIWTNRPLAYYDEFGEHCFMCKGYGKYDGNTCEYCDGKITQMETNNES